MTATITRLACDEDQDDVVAATPAPRHSMFSGSSTINSFVTADTEIAAVKRNFGAGEYLSLSFEDPKNGNRLTIAIEDVDLLRMCEVLHAARQAPAQVA